MRNNRNTSVQAIAVPRCVGVIIDGNRRWAREHGLPTLEGHRRGYGKVKKLLSWAKEAGVGHTIVYAFSTENWNRTKKEVHYLLNLFRVMVEDMLSQALREKVHVTFLGQIERLPVEIREGMQKIEEETKHFTDCNLGIAFSYGGRAEIIDAIKRIGEKERAHITEEQFSRLLWTKDFPDPDMIIRTSGEERLSGFLPWQSVYSELFFTKTYWPAFSKKEFLDLLGQFSRRKRRHGK